MKIKLGDITDMQKTVVKHIIIHGVELSAKNRFIHLWFWKNSAGDFCICITNMFWFIYLKFFLQLTQNKGRGSIINMSSVASSIKGEIHFINFWHFDIFYNWIIKFDNYIIYLLICIYMIYVFIFLYILFIYIYTFIYIIYLLIFISIMY